MWAYTRDYNGWEGNLVVPDSGLLTRISSSGWKGGSHLRLFDTFVSVSRYIKWLFSCTFFGLSNLKHFFFSSSSLCVTLFLFFTLCDISLFFFLANNFTILQAELIFFNFTLIFFETNNILWVPDIYTTNVFFLIVYCPMSIKLSNITLRWQFYSRWFLFQY